jgi:hypothetical protein
MLTSFYIFSLYFVQMLPISTISSTYNNNEIGVKSGIYNNSKFTVQWKYPIYKSVTVHKQDFSIQCLICSETEHLKTIIYWNGQICNGASEMKKTTWGGFNFELESNIKLDSGINKIFSEITNANECIRSDTVTIIYTGPNIEKRLALVIGNNSYQKYPLPYPAGDATAMAKILRELNFEVIEVIDGDKEKMNKAIHTFNNKHIEYKGVGLFYYSGHGVRYQDKNYMLPINYIIKTETDFIKETICLDSIFNYMDIPGNILNIVILDICHHFPSDLYTIPVQSYFTTYFPNMDNFFIAYGQTPGICECEFPCKYSLYSQELINALNRKGLRISDVFKEVRRDVYNLSGKKQIPWEYSSYEGEFYFSE